ncbi:MAG: DUF1801 domain-containing protein [Meiothermus sp.]|nr:DUF1801 domain-containing protein [Meiothermus sp.]
MTNRTSEKIQVTPEQLLQSWPLPAQQLAQNLRVIIRELCPDTHERAHSGWNILGYAYGKHPTWDMFCYVGFARGKIQLGFNNGTALPDPQKVLRGKAKHARSTVLDPSKPLPEQTIRNLVEAAYTYRRYLYGE